MANFLNTVEALAVGVLLCMLGCVFEEVTNGVIIGPFLTGMVYSTYLNERFWK